MWTIVQGRANTITPTPSPASAAHAAGSKAKAKGKSKAKDTPPGPPNAASRGRGRPRKDLSVCMRIELDMFQAVTMDETSSNYRKFLGDEWKTKERALKDLSKLVTTTLDSTDDVAVYDVLIADKKKLDALVSVCSSFVKSADTNNEAEFNHTFDEVELKRSGV